MSISLYSSPKSQPLADRVKEMTEGGQHVRDIAAALGVSARTVLWHRRRLGLTQPTAPRFTADELAAAETMLRDGASYTETARTLGRSRDGLIKHLPGYGWTPAEGGAYGQMMRRLNALAVRPGEYGLAVAR